MQHLREVKNVHEFCFLISTKKIPLGFLMDITFNIKVNMYIHEL